VKLVLLFFPFFLGGGGGLVGLREGMVAVPERTIIKQFNTGDLHAILKGGILIMEPLLFIILYIIFEQFFPKRDSKVAIL